MLDTSVPFQFDCEVDVFEKAGDPERERRIGGFVSTESIDKQGEIVIQKGLDFGPFVAGGWFNDNHSRATADIVGFPETADFVQKGQRLPDGRTADRTGWYVEGYLLKGHAPADRLWQLAKSLQRTKRRLGFSIEGKVTRRLEKSGMPVIASAVVKNVAITNCPVNGDTALEVLAKSLDGLSKALAAGEPSVVVPAATPLVGGGAVLMPESLDGAPPKKRKKRKLTKAQALDVIHARYPGISPTTARRILAFAASRSA